MATGLGREQRGLRRSPGQRPGVPSGLCAPTGPGSLRAGRASAPRAWLGGRGQVSLAGGAGKAPGSQVPGVRLLTGSHGSRGCWEPPPTVPASSGQTGDCRGRSPWTRGRLPGRWATSRDWSWDRWGPRVCSLAAPTWQLPSAAPAPSGLRSWALAAPATFLWGGSRWAASRFEEGHSRHLGRLLFL